MLPLKAVQCEFLVEGGLAQVTVTQVFFQENKAPMDCLYQFPLPADASVYACEVMINDRVIRAKVEEREAARKLVKQKKAEGRRTALVESERENLFTLSLGNLQPDDLIEVQLAYIQPLRGSAGSLSMTVPFCPGLRYIPGHPLLRSNRGKGVVDDTDRVPDASRISPVRMDQFHPDAAFVDIGGRIEAGFADAASVTSPSHRVTARSEDGFLRIELDDKGDVPDRDFMLRWKEKPATATAPRAWICRKDKEFYALMEIRAPETGSEAAVLPQDVYFLVDRSGSMEGQKWRKAVEALQNCVEVLGPQDRVMVTVFETTFNDFAEAPLPPSELLQDPNFRNLSRMGTGGGTEMGTALTHVLDLIRKHSPDRRTNLVLVTDAEVGNEQEILEIMRQAPRLAVHCFGIDIALNDALLLALTRQQGGTFHSLHPNDDISAAVSALGRTLRQPVLLDLKLSDGWETADHRLPDLYAGQLQYACAKGSRKSLLSMTARDTAGQAVEMQFETTDARNAAPFLHWCKTRIQRLLAEDVRSTAAIELSKGANVICKFTAFVAWDNVEKVAVATHELVQPSFATQGTFPPRTQPIQTMKPCVMKPETACPGFLETAPPQLPPRKDTKAAAPQEKPQDIRSRAPVVAFMGHAGHGKTSLLDALRKSNVAAGEAYHATRHIAACTISVPHSKRKGELQQVTFLDTPGHTALSSLRAHGANIADIVVLVIAANDGVMPQTLEALNQARAAKVPLIVAVNKVDHPDANPLRVRQQLQDKGLAPDDWGGDTVFVDVSALSKQGVDKLIEMILLQADLLELKANPNRRAKGYVIQSGLEQGGPTARVLVRNGTLHVGDAIVCGQCHGRVREMLNEVGQRLTGAGPSAVVTVLGLNGVPDAGVEFSAVEDEKTDHVS
jgi:small GTP-binding protein